MAANDSAIVEIKGVGLEFLLHTHARSLRDLILSRLHGRSAPKQNFWALKDVSLRVGHGERIGILGPNGAGKTTLLRVIAGILPPTVGTMVCRGRVVPLLELGLGFNNEMTASENILLCAVMMGKTRRQARQLTSKIIDFAELNDFRDVAVKYFSSGMSARLAFSIAMESEPEVLLLDEVFAVGDIHWVQRAEESLISLMKKARAIFVVSHNTDVLHKLCSRGIFLERGSVKMDGPMDDVIRAFRSGEATGQSPVLDNRDKSAATLDCTLEDSMIRVKARSLPVLGDLWVGIFAPGAARDDYFSYRRISRQQSDVEFHAPVGGSTPMLEVRLYRWLPGGEMLEASVEVRLSHDPSGHALPVAR
jgi:ABC-2 type transport system ATP-binding protein